MKTPIGEEIWERWGKGKSILGWESVEEKSRRSLPTTGSQRPPFAVRLSRWGRGWHRSRGRWMGSSPYQKCSKRADVSVRELIVRKVDACHTSRKVPPEINLDREQEKARSLTFRLGDASTLLGCRFWKVGKILGKVRPPCPISFSKSEVGKNLQLFSSIRCRLVKAMSDVV